MKKVSVIITTYKGHKEVEYAVLSVLNQTYKNIEVIVVDDNGLNTEEQQLTKKILKKYIDKKMIKYIPHKENINGSAARNTGANAAVGEWITFLDDDDIYLKNKVEVELNGAIKQNVDMVVCGGYYVNQKGCGYKTTFKKKKNLLLDYLTEKVLFNSSSIFIKRDKFMELNGFDDSFRRHQDWEFCTRAILKINVGIIKKHLYIKYTFGRNVASNAETAEKYLQHFLDKIGKVVKQSNKKKEFKKIKNYQVLRVAKIYHKNKDYKSFDRMMKRTDYKCYNFVLCRSYLSHIFKKLFYGLGKRCMSYNTCMEKFSLFREELF